MTRASAEASGVGTNCGLYAALSFETTAGLIMKHNYVAAMQVLILKLPIWQ